jgi:predicted nucleotidyltransferase
MHDLEDLLHIKVDVVNENALHHLVRDAITKEGISL